MTCHRARLLAVTILASALSAPGADWPMWRHGPNRGGASPEQLPKELHLQWTRALPPLRPAWPREPRLQFDGLYQPVVVGRTLFLGSSLTDSLAAYDTETGAERWRFFTDGPVRFAPVAAGGKVWFASDDGFLYCLNAADGSLIWRFRGGPANRKLLGNERLISAWPARGGPVLLDGVVYFAAGIWPFMGVFVHALDAATGRVIWTNRDCNSLYRMVDHNLYDYIGLSPQGYLVAVGDRLIVPCGRSWPACLDRKTGELIYFRQGQEMRDTVGKGWSKRSYHEGSCHVVANSRYLFNILNCGGRHYRHTPSAGTLGGVLRLTDGVLVQLVARTNLVPELVLTDTAIYGARGSVRAYSNVALAEPEAAPRMELPVLWEVASRAETLIKAGSRLYVGAKNELQAIDIPSGNRKPSISWKARVQGTPRALVAAAGRLFAVTPDGRLYCFGPRKVQPGEHAHVEESPGVSGDADKKTAASMLEATGVSEGYCVVLGASGLVDELLAQSKLHVIAIDMDREKVNALRRRLVSAGLHGTRAACLVGNPADAGLSPYLASLMVATEFSPRWSPRTLFRSLRPYGGVLVARLLQGRRQAFLDWVAKGDLKSSKVTSVGDLILLARVGALPGADWWTHEYADAARSMTSGDALVKPPFGVLWFGGQTDGLFAKPFFIPRYYPAPHVVGGRLFAQTVDSMSAVDVYTGRRLWTAKLPHPSDVYGVYHVRTPGYSSATTPDSIYVGCGERGLRLDTQTGRQLSELRLPPLGRNGERPYWGQVIVSDDLLIVGAAIPRRFWESAYARVGKEDLTTHEMLALDTWASSMVKAGKIQGRPGESRAAMADRVVDEILSSTNLPASFPPELRDVATKHRTVRIERNDRVYVMDRFTGKVLWTRQAAFGFTNIDNRLGNPRFGTVAVGDGKLFVLDSLHHNTFGMLKRRGRAPKQKPELLALDLRTGKVLWRAQDGALHKFWVAYSAASDVVLMGVAGNIAAFRGADGKKLWAANTPGNTFNRPSIIRGDAVITMYLKGDLTGKSLDTKLDSMHREWVMQDLLTGRVTRRFMAPGAYCGFATSGANFLAFRATSLAYYDFKTDLVRNLSGLRTGCANNLIPGDGVLSVPHLGWHCMCNYPIFASVSLIHMPEVAQWASLPPQNRFVPPDQ